MGLLSTFVKAGLAKKAISEARKPKNQRALKNLLSRNKGRGGRRTR